MTDFKNSEFHYQESYAYQEVGERKSFYNILGLIQNIHQWKSTAYGDSWIKRGLERGLIPNIDRKVDRLNKLFETIYSEGQESIGGEFADTLSDLAVYCLKGLTWMAEYQPEAFGIWLKQQEHQMYLFWESRENEAGDEETEVQDDTTPERPLYAPDWDKRYSPPEKEEGDVQGLPPVGELPDKQDEQSGR